MNKNNKNKKSALTLVELLVVFAIIVVVIAMIGLPSVRTARPAARRNQCLAQFKQIATALASYEHDHGRLPPAFTTDADGKPLHSWRTLILPYLDRQDLYETIDLTKPWNDPANASALAATIDAYQCPSAAIPNNYTTYLAVVTPNSALRPTESLRFKEMADGTASTLLVVEVGAERAVPWMSPADADEAIILAIGGADSKLSHDQVFMGAYADVHASAMTGDVPPDVRRALISARGNDNAVLGVD